MRKKRGPWMVTGTKQVYKNPWITVREDRVIRPDGKPGIFGVVEIVSGVSVLPINENGEIYLSQQFRYGLGCNTIEAFSGGIEKGETLLQAAKRELGEETGLIASNWKYLGWVDPFTSIVISPNHLFLARGLTEGQSHPEGTETINVIKISFEKALKMIEIGEITHSATVVLLLKAEKLLKYN